MAHRATSTATGYDPRVPTVAPPSGVAADDIVIIGFTAAPSGFTVLESGTFGGDGAFYWVGWKRAGGSESGYVFTLNAGAGLRRWAISATALSGRSTGGSVITDSTAGASGAPSITALAGDDLVYFNFADTNSVDGISAFAPPASFTERADLINSWAFMETATQDNVSAGATGTISGTETGSGYSTYEVLVAVAAPAGDTTAPVLTSPVAHATAATTATVGATTDEANGTLYSVITTSSTQPSVAQIKAGQNHLGASATWSGNQAISSTGAKTFSVTGLTAGTMYFTYTVHADAAGNNSNVVASGFAAYSVSAASVTPATQSVALNATGSFVYTLNVTPVSVTPVANVVALTFSTPVPTTTVVPVTKNIVLAVTLPVTRAQALPLTQSVALNFSGVVAYTLNVTPASPTIAMQDVALNPSYPSAGGVGATTGRRNRRYSYALKYFSRG